MLYALHEFQHAAAAPLRLMAHAMQELYRHPFMPLSYTRAGRSVAASAEVLSRTLRRYAKPEWGIDHITMDRRKVAVCTEQVLAHRFCNLLHFKRDIEGRNDPKVLVVAPLSGHYATLLRGTVRALLPDHEVYITDWRNARNVPLVGGGFGLDDYIDYVINFLEMLGPDVHVVAVCQPSVPVLAAVALMAEDDRSCKPRSMTLMGGPIDTRCNPTQVNKVAETKPIEWFEETVISNVPAYYPGFMRRVYPGFIQLNGFMSMNLDRHVDAHWKLFRHLIEGDGDSADGHREFYDEYLAVMDLPAEYYLETVKNVFQEHVLPKGTMTWRNRKVNPAAITQTALMTVEGEKDDITGMGQTKAAHDLCVNLPDSKRLHHLQKGVGHYGVFNGRRWREEIYPKLRDFIRANA
ncbi:MAG: polyhydroxyalkanoate depolymerase [Rhodospirillales bacterium]|nr:polyhydroxyalkanoate depolymerase [Rhodospirillales bacterium]